VAAAEGDVSCLPALVQRLGLRAWWRVTAVRQTPC